MRRRLSRISVNTGGLAVVGVLVGAPPRIEHRSTSMRATSTPSVLRVLASCSPTDPLMNVILLALHDTRQCQNLPVIA
eukprot:6734057-Pyramimonas_sp.AAC.1